MPSISKRYLAYLERQTETLNKITTRSIKQDFETITKGEFYELLGDRYSIYYRTHFEDGVCPLPQYYVEEFIKTHKSDLRSPKSTITNNITGEVIKETEGIEAHDILEDIMRKFGLQEHITFAYSSWGGRQRIHSHLMERCWEYIEKELKKN
jgi:hypothetical protein